MRFPQMASVQFLNVDHVLVAPRIGSRQPGKIRSRPTMIRIGLKETARRVAAEGASIGDDVEDEVSLDGVVAGTDLVAEFPRA